MIMIKDVNVKRESAIRELREKGKKRCISSMVKGS